jgi:hypothetical protein
MFIFLWDEEVFLYQLGNDIIFLEFKRNQEN